MRRRGRVTFAVVALAVLFALAAAWHDLANARDQLTRARTTLEQIVADPSVLKTAEGRATALDRIATARRRIDAARKRLRGSAPIAVARVVPGLSRQRAGALGLVTDASVGIAAGERLLRKVNGLADKVQLANGTIPFDGLEVLRADLGEASATMRGLARSDRGLWGQLGEARRRFDDIASSSSRRLGDGANALAAARTFLGGAGDRRYVVALQNNAEMRDQGIVLSYAVARFTATGMAFERVGHINDLDLDRPASTPIPAGTQTVFRAVKPTLYWQSVNSMADFAWSGRAMTDMAIQKLRVPVDGVIAIDVPGLASLLRAVGPIEVPGIGGTLTADNLSQVLLHDLYEGLPAADGSGRGGPQQEARIAQEANVARGAIERLTSGAHDAVSLGRELGDAAAGGHLRLWSSRTSEQRVFEDVGLSGGPAGRQPDRSFHVAVENRTGTKLDYYVKPSLRVRVRLTPQGGAFVRTDVVVDNPVPAGQAPSYQLGPDPYTKHPGDYVAWVLFWGPTGAAQAAAVPESGLQLTPAVMNVGPGERRETSFATLIPDAVRDGKLSLRWVPQPRLYPVDLDIQLEAPGWSVQEAPASPISLDRPRTLTWTLKH